ncbi:unnamed protein product [Scytosiphon promiscuus]
MFLAATGRLKHKRTRNTIAAEPTPRSSCSSNKAEPSAVVAAPAAADRFRVGTAAVATPTHRHERESATTNGNTTRGAFSPSYRRETPGSRAGCDSDRRRDIPGRLAGGSSAFEDSGAPCVSPPRSPIQMSSPLASAKVPGPYLHCCEAERDKSMLTADENPPPGASGRRGGPGMESSPAMSTASPRTQQTCDAATRLTSGGDVDRRSKISRSAAVQAAGLTSAAAACDATIQKLLRRTILGKATENSGARQVSAPSNTTAAAMRVNAQTRERNRKGNGGVGRPGSPSLVRAAGGQDDGVVGWKGRSRSKGASMWDVTRTKNECHRSTPKHTLTSDHGDNVVTAGADSSNGSGKVPRTADEQRGTERGRSPCRARLSNFADPGSVYGRGSNLSSRCSTSNCEGVCLSTARTSNATSCSSRSANTRKCLNSRRWVQNRSHTEVAERRMHLLAELKTLRRRMKRAEGLLREVDSSLLSRPARR